MTKCYGNFISNQYAATLPKPGATVGTEATILWGRDREPAKVVEVVYNKAGGVKGYVLQRFHWAMDSNTEGYAKEIHWDRPNGEPSFHPVVTHGKMKGTVKGALIGAANPFYDRTF